MLPWQPFLAFYIWGAHWRHLKNTIEPSMCIGDAALCQITLTTCYDLDHSLHRLREAWKLAPPKHGVVGNTTNNPLEILKYSLLRFRNRSLVWPMFPIKCGEYFNNWRLGFLVVFGCFVYGTKRNVSISGLLVKKIRWIDCCCVVFDLIHVAHAANLMDSAWNL